MVYEKFIEKIAYNNEGNPFHEFFSLDYVKNLISEDIDDNDKIKNISTILFLILTNPYYKNHYQKLGLLFEDKDIAINFYLNSIISTNNDFISISEKLKNQIQTSDFDDIIAMQNIDIKTISGNMNLINLLDESIDVLDFNYNMLSFCSSNAVKLFKKFDSRFNDSFLSFHQINNYFEVMKSIYNEICFENSIIEIRDNQIKISSDSNKFNLYKQVSYQRIIQNLSINYNYIIQDYKIKNLLKKESNFNKVRIKNVRFNSSYFDFNYENNFEDNISINELYLNYKVALNSYHFHLSNEKKKIIDEIAQIFTALKYLSIKIVEYINEYTTLNKSKPIIYNDLLQCKLKKSTVIKFLTKITILDTNKIIKYIKYFENDSKQSFWIRPILINYNNYYLILHSIISANFLNLIDCWCQDLFHQVSKKGFEFEDFLKNSIDEYCKNKNYQSKIYQQKKFNKNKKEHEEIDLIWETKHTLLIGEVKCIRYPFSSRNFSSFHKIIEKATKQINRKTKFLLDNKEKFSQIDFSKENIISCVITNYPLLTGCSINSVPIIDIGVFSSYIDAGYTANTLILENTTKQINKKKFYNNEDEFSKNIISHFNNPSVFSEIELYLSSEYREIKISEKLSIYIEEYLRNDIKIDIE